MAAAKSKKEEVVAVDLAPMQKEIDALKSELSSLKKEMTELKKAPKASAGGSSALAQQLVDALKEMTGPNTKGVRNYVRSIFK
jgi:hypothetical protein